MGISRHHHNFLNFPKVLGSLGCQTTPDQKEAPVLEHSLLRGHALRAVGCEGDFPARQTFFANHHATHQDAKGSADSEDFGGS
jgi:hypothetical protein